MTPIEMATITAELVGTELRRRDIQVRSAGNAQERFVKCAEFYAQLKAEECEAEAFWCGDQWKEINDR